jgi:hypothetical protein
MNNNTGPQNAQSNDDSVYARLEAAIRRALLKYQGRYEETFVGWYAALKLIEPELAHPRQLINAFNRLSNAGIIQLHNADGRLYEGRDDSFFLGGPFTTVLTTHGAIQPPAPKI